MAKRIAVVMGIFGLLVYGANVQDAQALEKIVKEETITTIYAMEELVRVADNVVILFDSSSSMEEPYGDGGMTKLQAAKRLLKQRAELFPDVFPDLKVGLYTYTPPASILPNWKGYEVFYEMQSLKKADFLKAVDRLPDKGSGPTLLQNALLRLDDLLERLSGRTVVFLFTDGSYSESEGTKRPVVLARNLAKKHDVSFQVISTGDREANKRIMEAVASVNERSRVYPLEALLDRPEVYTGAVFVIQESYLVLSENREKVVGYELEHILFDFDESAIRAEFTSELDAAGEMLKKNPDSYIILAGFTDDRGTEEYNLGLSRRRAEAVGNYLVREFQVDEERVVLFWYGAAAPRAGNDTEEGRQKNRRVFGVIAGVD